jgi:hypothetical protein
MLHLKKLRFVILKVMESEDEPTPIEILIRARSVLRTCLDDTPEDLKTPARRSVIELRIREITEVLKRHRPNRAYP